MAESTKIVPLHRVETDKVEESIEKETTEVVLRPKLKYMPRNVELIIHKLLGLVSEGNYFK